MKRHPRVVAIRWQQPGDGDEVRPGVVSLPHGFGHDLAGVRLAVARAHGGVNVNQVSDPGFVDGVSANAAFNGVAVEVTPATR